MTKLIANFKPVLWIVLIAFIFNTIMPQPAQADVSFLPAPGQLISLTPSFSPPLIRGLKIYRNNPFKFQFIMSEGDPRPGEDNEENFAAKQLFLKEEGNKLVKYFLASLTVPEKDMWVNLSPYERNRIIPTEFGITEMGKELLAQDYLLKQVTASVMYPEGNVGKEFWRLIYQEAYKRFGTTNIPVNTFNKVWIVPESAVVYENPVDNTVVITESKLKVMLEEDYLALNKSAQRDGIRAGADKNTQLSNELIRQVILPLLKKEVNTGKNFAVLRQVYNSLILALWYKEKLKQTLISKGYVDRNKTNGVEVKDKNVDQEIYRQYLKSYKKGVYNYIKEELGPDNEMIPRKYFSGGFAFADTVVQTTTGPDSAQIASRVLKPLKMFVLTVGISAALIGVTPAFASAQQATPTDGTQLAQTYAVTHQDTHFLNGIANETDELTLISSAINEASQGTIKLYADGIKELVKDGVVKIDDQTITDLSRVLPGGQHTVTLDLDQIRYIASKTTAKTSLLPPAPTITVAPLTTEIVAPTPLPAVTAPATVHVKVKVGDTVSSIFGNSPEVKSIVASMDHSKKVTASGLIASGHVSILDSNGATVQHPDFKLIYPGQSVVFNLTDFVKHGGPIAGPSAVVNSGAVYAGVSEAVSIDQQIAQNQSDITTAAKAIQDNLNEQQLLRAQIQASNNISAGAPPPDEVAREQDELVAQYHLSVPNLAPVPLPYQSPGVAPPITTFNPDAVGIAWIDYQLKQIQQQDQTAIPSSSPIKGVGLLSYNRDYVALPLGKGPATFNIEPDIPFGNFLRLSQMGQGFARFGAQSSLNQVAGPLFAGQIMLDLRNYVVMHPTRGQDVRYDVRVKNPLSGILQSLTVHVIPILSHDQQGRVVEEHLYSVGLVDTFQAVLGKIDGALGGKGIVGNSSSHFVTSNLGYQLKVNDYHQAFTHAARINADPNAIYINVYNVEDANMRYRKNKSSGWGDVDASTPLDSRLDYYSATVNGFILHVDPATGQITGQRVYTAPTFVTDAFARQLTQANGGTVEGRAYLDPKATFMERVASVQDLKQEQMLLKGVDEQGRVIWGVLRNPISGRIEKVITDPQELNSLSRLKDAQGRVAVQFVAGRAYHAPSGLGSLIRDYTSDEFSRAWDEYKGVFHRTTQAAVDNGVDLSKRPQLTQVPPALQSLFGNNALIFDPSIALKAVTQASRDHYGMIYFIDGSIPAVLTSMDHVKTVASLNETNGVHKLDNGLYILDGSDNNLDGKTLVLLNDQGKAIGIVDPSNVLRQERINNLDVENQNTASWQSGLQNYGNAIDQNDHWRPLLSRADDFIPAKFAGSGVVGQKFGTQKPTVITGDMMVRTAVQDGHRVVVEILQAGLKTMEDRKVILDVLAHGGVEALDHRGIDPRTGEFRVSYFARGNDLTPGQQALNIHPESELARMAVASQATYVPIKGSDKLQLVILKEDPPSRLGQTAAASPAVNVNTMEDVNRNYVLVRLFRGSRAGGTGEAQEALPTERVLVSDLNRLAPALSREAFEILQLDAKGDTIGRYVRMYGSGYQLWKNSELVQKSRSYFLVVFKDKRGAEYISLEQLKDPKIYDAVRRESSEISMRTPNQQVTARVYLSKVMSDSRIEVMHADHTSLIFDLLSYSPATANRSNAVAETKSVTDPQGFLHVTTTDLRPVNKDVIVEDVYQHGQLLYSNRFVQKERIYFKNGHEEYSVSLDYSIEPGQTVLIDGHQVQHVTGLFQFDPKTNSGYHIGLRNMAGDGWYAPIRYSQFADGVIKEDETGFVKIPQQGLSYDQIMQLAKSSGVINMRDVYAYHADGSFDSRVISFMVDGKWQLGWTLDGNEIGPQKAMVDQLLKNADIAGPFAHYGLNDSTVLIKTIKTTPDGVTTEDYRIYGDVLERKMISVIKQDGAVIKIIVGLDFQAKTGDQTTSYTTGEQTQSYTLTPDWQVQSESRTVAGNQTFRQILNNKEMVENYRRFMQEHMNIPNADLATDLARAGVSLDFVPVVVKETPFMIQTDVPKTKGYKLIEPLISPLIRAYEAADPQARPAILGKISDILRQYHRGSNAAHYTSLRGIPTYHYLAPPNDSRGRDFITRMGNGDVALNLWWLEGKGKFKANILPASIVVDQFGVFKRMMAFDHDANMVFKNAQDQPYTLRVNTYSVYHDQDLVSATYTSLGQRVSETSRYVRNRVVNGQWGVQTRGQETIHYDPMSPYAIPLYGTLDEDGRLTKVDLHLEYSAGVDGQGQNVQQIVETADINEPTAPGDYKIKTQTIIDGSPVIGSLHQEEMLKGYLKGVAKNWRVYIIYPGMLFGLFVIGDFIKRKRLAKIRKELAETDENPTVETTEVPILERDLVYPENWNAKEGANSYGFSQDVVNVAKERYEGTIIPMLKKESLEDVLKEYFKGYNIWRRQVMGIEEPFIPTVEDLWVMFLRDADSEAFSADVPDGLNYWMHKAIQARERDEKAADIGGFIRKEYTRWHNILELQETSFQGIAAGTMRHVVPYDYYFTAEDLNEMFRTKGNIDWYDGMGYSLDGNEDTRGAIYNDFIAALKEKVAAAKAAVEALAADVDKNVFKTKRRVTNVQAYKDYVKFFLDKIQKGNYQVSDKFSFPGISTADANALIDHKPLVRKTFSESGAGVGKLLPLPVRIIKPMAQFVRNSYNQLTYPLLLTTTVGLFMAAFDGLLTWGAATMTAAAGFIIAKALYYPLSHLLDNKVNFKSFGKPKDFWAGYSKAKLTTAQKWYRGSFWSIVIAFKVGWDAFLLHNFLVPFRETIGSTYMPVIAGHHFSGNFNLLLMGMLWSTSAIFLYVSSYAATYLVKPFFTFTHGAIRGLGTIKTSEDIRRLEADHTLDRLIEQKLLPWKGAGLTDQERANARKAIIKYIFDQHRNMRDEISDEEYRTAVQQGRFDHIKNPEVQKSIAQSVNALIMDMPRMPDFDDNMPVTVLTPVYGEDLIYAYSDSSSPTTLDMMLNTGYTNLNFIISKAPQRWKNLIERVRREGIGSEDEWKRMEALLPQEEGPQKGQIVSGKLGDIDEDLKRQIRLWASYEGQPFARTMDGLMNIPRAYQLYYNLAHPREISRSRLQEIIQTSNTLSNTILDPSAEGSIWEEVSPKEVRVKDDVNLTMDDVKSIAGEDFNKIWPVLEESQKASSKQKMQREINKKFQLIWAYQIWGNVLNAKDDKPDEQLKREDTLFLLKRYYDELGFLVDIVSLQKRDGLNVKVLSRYNPQTQQIEDVRVIKMTANNPVMVEGKPANQMHAMSFARNKFRFTIDINQDLDPMEALKIPIIIQEFNDKNVAIVNTPEEIFTSTFSKTGELHAFSDRTFVTSDKRHMGMISSPAHHGHPDVWRDTDITEHGGVSSTVAVSEDYKGGLRLMLRGRTILNREYMQWKKGRELSWTGTDGIWRKFSMGAAQLLLGRYANWMNKRFGLIDGLGEFYTGPHFYTLNTIAAIGFFVYTINVMLAGISPFTAFPAPFVTMMTGVLWVGQAITVIGITQMVLENGIKKGIAKFAKLLAFIVPFYVAHIFTYQAGFLSGLAGLAAYVATGRGFNRENLTMDKLLKTFTKSHIIVGTAGLALASYAYNVWRNETFLLSSFTILAFIFPMVMPFIMNPGNYPIHGVTAAKSFQLFKTNLKDGAKFIGNNFWKEGLAKQEYKKIMAEKGRTKGIIEALRRTDYRRSLIDTVAYSIAFGIWGAVTAPVVLPAVAATTIRDKIRQAVTGKEVDKVMTATPGGIDLGKTVVSVDASRGVIQTAFDDPAMLRLLLNADGLAPIIYNIRTMTPSMVDHFVGVDQ